MTRSWITFAFAIIVALTAAHCARDVPIGVAPSSDAATDATGDASVPD